MGRSRDTEGALDSALGLPSRLKEDAGRILAVRSECLPGYHCRSKHSGCESPQCGRPTRPHGGHIPRPAVLRHEPNCPRPNERLPEHLFV